MIKKIINGIRILIFMVIALTLATTYLDYLRIAKGKEPLFSIKEYNPKTKIQTYRGIIYKATRTINMTESEDINNSEKITYKILNKDLDIPNNKTTKKYDYVLLNNQKSNCNENSKLYYANKKVKVYTYCLDSIKVKEANKANSKDLIEYLKTKDNLLDDIKNKFTYVGLDKSKTTSIYKTLDEKFTNNKLIIYECNKENINDIYIAPIDTQIKEDFCTYKDDDWSFLWEVKEETYTKEEEFKPDLFFEDEKNLYELTKTTKDLVYLVTPSIRGKEATSIPLMEVFGKENVTLEELKLRGLNYQIVDKKKREKELKEKEKETEKDTTQEN